MTEPVSPSSATRRPGSQRHSSLWQRLEGYTAGLYPGYFALVMATGIISNTALLLQQQLLADALFAVNLVAYPWLVLATLVRTARFPRRLWADLTNPGLVFSFFTIVAASDVLGIQLHLRGLDAAAIALWVFAFTAWILLSYFSFSLLTFVNTRSEADVIHGGWLIAIVGTESLVILGTLLAPGLGTLEELMLVTVHMLWGIGVAFYAIFITLFSYRLFFRRVDAADMTPLFWVVMGAAAISTNAGSTLILADTDIPFLLALRPFVDGVTLIMWAWGTWWIPLLLVFGFWKYGVQKDRLAYHPSFWSLVFPLGMYSLATYRLSLAADFPPLLWVPRVMIWAALVAWAVTMYGALASSWRGLWAGPRSATD